MLTAEEAKWTALLGESRSGRTNAIRQVRHKALQVAQTRIQTVLNRFADRDGEVMTAELVAALDKAGL